MAITGFKATLSVNDGASNAQVVFASAAMVNLPWGEVKTDGFTVLSDKVVQKVPTSEDPGQLNFELIYTKADYARLIALKGRKYYGTTTATSVVWVVTTPDEDGTTATLTPSKSTFHAILTKVDVDLDNDNITRIKATAEVSGPITIESGENEGGE